MKENVLWNVFHEYKMNKEFVNDSLLGTTTVP